MAIHGALQLYVHHATINPLHLFIPLPFHSATPPSMHLSSLPPIPISIHPSILPSAHSSIAVSPSVHTSISSSVPCLFIHLPIPKQSSVEPFFHALFNPSMHPSISLHLSTYLYFSTSVHTFIYLYPSAYIFTCTSIHLSTCLFYDFPIHIHVFIHTSPCPCAPVHLCSLVCPLPLACMHGMYFLDAAFLKLTLGPLRSAHSAPPQLSLLPFLSSHSTLWPRQSTCGLGTR